MSETDQRPTALILPGLDGTGQLLGDFASALELRFKPIILRYPTDVALGYDQLFGLIEANKPEGDYLVIGESFSGPLALRHAFTRPAGLKAVVLGASFARLDLPAKPLVKMLARTVSPRLLPAAFLHPLLLGRWSTPRLRQLLKSALASVNADVLAGRAQAALDVDLTSAMPSTGLPLLYLRAMRDRLMPKTAVQSVSICAVDMTIEDVLAPHFIFQTAPEHCAARIAAFYDRAIQTAA